MKRGVRRVDAPDVGPCPRLGRGGDKRVPMLMMALRPGPTFRGSMFRASLALFAPEQPIDGRGRDPGRSPEDRRPIVGVTGLMRCRSVAARLDVDERKPRFFDRMPGSLPDRLQEPQVLQLPELPVSPRARLALVRAERLGRREHDSRFGDLENRREGAGGAQLTRGARKHPLAAHGCDPSNSMF